MGLHPGPDWTPQVTARHIAGPTDRARSLLVDQGEAILASEHRPGRYAFHGLIHDHAADLTARLDSGTECREAMRRMLDHYVHTAALLVDPGIPEIVIPLAEPAPGVVPEPLADREAAMTLFEAVHPAMMAVVQAASDFNVHVWQPVWAFREILLPAAQNVALAASERLGDPAVQAYSHRALARADSRLGQFADGRTH